MRQIRLYVDAPLADARELVLPAPAARHAVRVLRLKQGQPLALFNGDGHDYHGVLMRIEGTAVHVHLHERHPVATESPWPLTLAQSLARGQKMDLIVQKATELGATRIVPLISERSEVRLDAARAAKRLHHWQGVAIAACEQCGRARIPRIDAPRTLHAWLDRMEDPGALRLALLPGAGPRVRGLPWTGTGAVVVIGPEGGLGERDTAALFSAGYQRLSLGPRILRTETAGVAALAAIQACHGDG